MKRFYQQVTQAGCELRLDEKQLLTPGKRVFKAPTAALAEAVAEEWRAQVKEIKPDSMPLTQLAFTAQDLLEQSPEATRADVTAFAAHDLICYWAEAPQALVARQEKLWRPLLAWVAERYDAPLVTTTGVVTIQQPPQSLKTLARRVASFDAWHLAALMQATQISGSLVIALALMEGELTLETAFEAAELDASFQMERWGEDAEAQQRRHKLLAEIAAASRFVQLLAD